MPQSLRRHDREASSEEILLGWTDSQGHLHQVRGKCLDISEFGLQIESMEPVAVRTYVLVKSRKLGIDGSASVRHCTRKGIRYRLGLEFSGGLRYRPRS